MRPASSATEMNCVGSHPRRRRVGPSGEGLEPQQPIVGQLDDGLVGQPELPPLETAAQSQLEGSPLLDLRAHLDVEHLDPGIGLDGTGHGDAGVGDELVDRPGPDVSLALALGDGDADRGADEGLVVVDDEGVGHRLDHPGGEVGGGGGVDDSFGHDHETVLGESTHQGIGSDRGHDPTGRLADESIPGGVAERIGHHADPLQADEEHGDVAATDGGPPERGFEVDGEQHPVGQLGELVVGGPMLELALRVGVVGDGADEADDLTVVTEDGGQPAPHRAHPTSGGNDPAVDDPGVGLGEHATGDGHQPVTIVGVHRGEAHRPVRDVRVVAGELEQQPVGVHELAVLVEEEDPDGQVVGEPVEGRVGVSEHQGPRSLGDVGEVDLGSRGRLGHPRRSFIGEWLRSSSPPEVGTSCPVRSETAADRPAALADITSRDDCDTPSHPSW